MENPLLKKMWARPGYTMLVQNSPEGFLESLQPVPLDAQVVTAGDGPFDWALLFVRNRTEIDQFTQGMIARVRPQAVVWFAYPKGGKAAGTDINRDQGWESLYSTGWEPVTQVAIDAVWSALRFKPLAEIPSRRRPAA